MPNPRDIQEMNTRSLALIMENDPTVARIFDHMISPETHVIFGRPPIMGEMQTSPIITMGTVSDENFPPVVAKFSPPSFLNKEQSEFFMNKFPLKDKNE